MEHFKEAWTIVKQNLTGWIIFGAVLGVLMGATGGIGAILFPNAMRATRDAIAGNRAPELGELFKFETITDDLVAMIVYFAAAAVGSFVVVGSLITVPLVWWVPMLAADGKYVGLEAAKASFAHAKANFMAVFVFVLIAMVLNWIGTMACFLPILVTAPVTLVASWRFYEQNKAQIEAAAQAGGAVQKA